MKLHFVMLSLISLGLVSCAKPQGNDRQRELAEIDAKTGQDVTDARSRQMEARLLRQQRFFQALNGTFLGKMIVDKSKPFDVRFVITPTIPIYDEDRVRSPDEITYDITNLALNIEESTSAPLSGGDTFSSGCYFAALKPKLDGGYVLASSTTCAVSYTLSLGTRAKSRNGKVQETAEDMTRKVLNGEIDQIDELYIEMRSIHRPGVTAFVVNRSEP